MKRYLNIAFCTLAAAGIIGCATKKEEAAGNDSRLFFESWIHVHHPEAAKSGNGIYVLERKEAPAGEKETVSDSQYVYVNYTVTDLNGKITSYSRKETAVRLGEYEAKKTHYFGPRIWSRSEGSMYAGVNDMFEGTKKGDTVTAAIPGWLMSYKWYGSEQEYIDNVSGSNAIYEVEVVDPVSDIEKWQIDSVGRFLAKSQAGFGDDFGYLDIYDIIQNKDTVHTKLDSTSYGFYFINIDKGKPLPVEDEDGKELEIPGDSHFYTKNMTTDTTIYINYVGRLLNGLVFDTNIRRVAQDNGLSGGKYEPAAIQWADKPEDLRMGEGESASSVIAGFSKTLWQMHPDGKALGIFISRHGYGAGGSGNAIPAYSPLIFEIEIVKDPDSEEK